MTLVDWRLRRTGTDTLEPDLYDVYIKDAVHRFAREAKAWIYDKDGSKRSTYKWPTPVQLEYKRNIDSSWTTRWGGFVSNPKTKDNLTEVHCLSHDFWLKKNFVSNSYTDKTISYILEDLITLYTPLNWNASLVDVSDDETITREWKGVKLTEILSELASRSAEEEWGANNDAEFFFRPPETSQSPRDFTEDQWFDAEFGEDGKEQVTKVTVSYGEGGNADAIAVQDRSEQQRLKDELGLPRAPVNEIRKNFPEITSETEAERKARSILGNRELIRTGELKTWEAFDVQPGDTAPVVVPDQDVDDDFRVAQIEYRWKEDETTVQLAENETGVVDTLVTLADEVTRVDLRDAGDVTPNEVVDIVVPIEVATSIEVFKRDVPDSMFAFGDWKSGLGDPAVGGGELGDQRGSLNQVI